MLYELMILAGSNRLPSDRGSRVWQKNNVNSSYIQVGPAILTNYRKQNTISNYKAGKYMLLKTHLRGYYVCCWLQIVCFSFAFPYIISLLHITSKLLLTSHFICLIPNCSFFFSRIEWHFFCLSHVQYIQFYCLVWR